MIRRLIKLLAPFAAAAIIVFVFRSDSDSTGLNVSDDRLVRAAPDDKLKDSIEKLQMVARITNVLYLQVGLTKGNEFDSEELISELLHFGAVKPKDIQNLDLTTIENAFDALKTLPSKLGKNDKLEDVFIRFGNILNEIKNFDTFDKWNGKADYEADMKRMKNDSVNIDFIKSLGDAVTQWKTHYDTVIDFKTLTSFALKHYGNLEALMKATENLKTKIGTLKTGAPAFFNFKTGTSAKTEIDNLIRISKVIKILQRDMETKQEDIDALELDMQQVTDSVTQTDLVSPHLKTISDVYFYRFHPNLSPLFDYTPGMAGGFEDVGKVTVAFQEEWFKKMVKNESLKAAYPAVNSLGTSVITIDKLLGAPSDQLETLTKIFIESGKVKSFENFPIENARTVANCFKDVKDNHHGVENKVDKFIELAAQIDKELDGLTKILTNAGSLLTAQENNLGDVLETMKKADENNQNSIDAAFKELFGSKLETLEQVYESLTKIDIRNMETDKFKQFAEDTLREIPEVTEYENDMQQNEKNFNCLLKAKDEASKVISAFQDSKLLKQLLNGIDFEHGIQYVKNVVGTQDELKSLNSFIDKAKGVTSSEAIPLKKLNQTDVKIIGLSTRAVANMKALIDRKSEFEVFKTYSQLVQNEKEKHSSNFQPDGLALLDNIINLGSSLDTMYSELDTWQTAINSQNFSTLNSFSEIFKEAGKVNGLKEDISKMTEELQKLIDIVEVEDHISSARRKRSIDNLNEIRTALISLADLQFSKYTSHFANSKETLSSIDMFFANYVKDLMKLLTSPIPPKRIQHVNAPGASKEELEEIARNAEKWRWIITGICLGVLGAIAILVVVCCCCCKRRRMPCNQTIKKFTPFNVKPRVALRYLRNLKSQVDYIEKHCMVKNGPKGESANQEKARKNVFYQFCLSICTASAEGKNEKVVAPYNKLHNQMLVSKNIRPDSAIKLDATGKDTDIASTFYHGNLMIMRNLFKVILMQGAVDPSSNPGKVSTIHKLWKLAKKYKVKTIVMLSNLSEENKEGARYFARNLNDTFNVGENSEIRCNAINDHEKITTRQLEYFENKGDKNGHEVLHLQHTSWGDWQLPATKGIRQMLERVRISEGPVMVHCSDGLGRTGAFVYTEKLLQAIHFSKDEDGDVDHGDLLREMRETRACCIQQPENLMVPIMTVLDMFFEKIEGKNLKPVKMIKKKNAEGEVENVPKRNAKFGTEDYEFYQKLKKCYADLVGN